jgi:acetyl-CoA C-acetyltransferase
MRAIVGHMSTPPSGRDGTAAGRTHPRSPCLIGWSQHTWPKSADDDAPEPLDMWELVTRRAAAATGSKADVLAAVDSAQVTYTQSWQYDDPVGRLSDQLGVSPRHRLYSGIGGTTPQVLVQEAAASILRGEIETVLVTSAEALDTVKKIRTRGERPTWSFRDPVKKPFPFEAPFVPAEVAHEVFQAWLTFAMFDNARRAHRGVGLAEHRANLAQMWHRFSSVAAVNPNAWFPLERSAEEILTVTPTNRMVGYPYTKYMVSVMDVDMAAALILTSHEKADALGVPTDQRVYLRGWCYATDAQPVAGHREMWRSPAMAAASAEALARARIGIDDVAHLDLYSCFGSSVDFARDALGLDGDDARPLTVTGGLPYFGGAGSGYMSHSVASMADALRADPGWSRGSGCT